MRDRHAAMNTGTYGQHAGLTMATFFTIFEVEGAPGTVSIASLAVATVV
jgi:hypothetical protein